MKAAKVLIRSSTAWSRVGRVGLARPCPAGLGVRAFASYSPPIELIKQLRAASGAPVGDCKKALAADDVQGDMQKAMEWLRKKGMAQATKKAGRTISEGLIGISQDAQNAVIVELNSETDFVARNEIFQSLLRRLTAKALEVATPGHNVELESFLKEKMEAQNGGTVSVEDAVAEAVGVIGENLSLRRVSRLSVPAETGLLCSYTHQAVVPGMGTSGAIVALNCESLKEGQEKRDALTTLGKRLAMHIVAAQPQYLDPESIPRDVLDREKEFLSSQAATSGKPAHLISKIIEGRLNKFYGEVTLLHQPHMVEEGNPKVQAVLKAAEKKLGGKVEVTGFVRYRVGETSVIEKEKEAA